MFCDSDDILPAISIESLYKQHDKADIIVGTLEIIDNKKKGYLTTKLTAL